MHDWTRLSLGIDSISLECSKNMKNNVVLNKNCVEGKPCINRESKSNELKI